MLAEGVRWFDDWFAIEDIATGIYGLGEPRYHWYNWSYLIEGKDRALLFDTGSGVRDISAVVASLTKLPLTALPSHMHFDHTGNLHRFEVIALPDLPVLRACERGGVFHATDDLFLGFTEGMTWQPVNVSQWLPIGAVVDLGERKLEVIHTPGHSPDSISLLDAHVNILFAADFVYPGDLYAQFPGSNLQDYLRTADRLLERISDDSRIFCAHGKADNRGKHRAPMMGKEDVSDLGSALAALRKSRKKPAKLRINRRMSLNANDAAYVS